MSESVSAESARSSAAQLAKRITAEVSVHVEGMAEEIQLLLCAIVAGRHVLVEGVPGIGKTLLVRTMAEVLGCSFRRIQFMPDLLPADILGGNIYDGRDGSFSLRRGPIFAHVVLADEINRAPAKTQSALLEVMEERQVTIEGETIPMEPPFFVLATQNPAEHEGVYPLPQAQLDRFGMRLVVGYPDKETEAAILSSHRDGRAAPTAVAERQDILNCQGALSTITVSDQIVALLVELASAIREHDAVTMGASPRLGLDVLQLARARALLAGRDHVLPDDIKALYHRAANHRIQLTPYAEVRGTTPGQIIDAALQSTELV